MMKVQTLAIAYSLILQQVQMRTLSFKQANQQLYSMGEEIGLRIADEYNERESSFLSPAQTIKSMLINATKEYLGIKLELIEDNISFEKRVHTYQLRYMQAGFDGTILSFCSEMPEKLKQLRPGSIVSGFIFGMLRTMDFYGQVVEQKQEKGMEYRVLVKKDIKQDD